MKVENAFLSGESDIRQWTQQLGRQLSGQMLSFDMVYEMVPDETGVVKVNNTYHYHYKVQMFLDKNPLKKVLLFDSQEALKNKKESKEPSGKVYLLKEEVFKNSTISRNEESCIWKRRDA